MNQLTPDTFDRTTKFFVDRDDATPSVARAKLEQTTIEIFCGPELNDSPTLQVAALTAVNVAKRCFQGDVYIVAHESAKNASLFNDKTTRFLDTIVSLGADVQSEMCPPNAIVIAFGSCETDGKKGIQTSFDGWSVSVSPLHAATRQAEREMFAGAGVALGAMAIAEIFSSIAETCVEACRREIGLSLWRPDLHWTDHNAIGLVPSYVPTEFWLLGLGHLGQAYSWTIGFLPFSAPEEVIITLNDFDRIVPANIGSGLIAVPADNGKRKTRVVANWFESKGFQTNLVERAFDKSYEIGNEEPALALCGFDGRGPRWVIDQVGFQKVIECGLGGEHHNFDSISIHTFPGNQPAKLYWPESMQMLRNQERAEELARSNRTYQRYKDKHKCGHVELAGKAISVPFVGAIAASLVVSEAVRSVNEGPQFNSLSVSASEPADFSVQKAEGPRRLLRFQPSKI